MQPLSDPKAHFYPTIEEGGTESRPDMKYATPIKTATCDESQVAVSVEAAGSAGMLTTIRLDLQ